MSRSVLKQPCKGYKHCCFVLVFSFFLKTQKLQFKNKIMHFLLFQALYEKRHLCIFFWGWEDCFPLPNAFLIVWVVEYTDWLWNKAMGWWSVYRYFFSKINLRSICSTLSNSIFFIKKPQFFHPNEWARKWTILIEDFNYFTKFQWKFQFFDPN